MMSRRAAALLGSLVVLGAASGVVAVHSATSASELAAATAQRAHTALAAAGDALLDGSEALAERSRTAAALGPIQRMTSAGVDPMTWHDFLLGEAAWEPFRAAGSSAVVVGQTIMAAQGPLPPPQAILELARTAAASGSAHGLEGLTMVAAARVGPQTPTGLIAVVVLAEPLTPSMVRAVAERSGAAALAVRAGARTLGEGDAGLLTRLGAPGAGAEPCCVHRQLTDEVNVAVAVDASDLREARERATTRVATIAFGLAIILALGLVTLGLLSPSSEERLRLQRAEEELNQSRRELKRLTNLFESASPPVPSPPSPWPAPAPPSAAPVLNSSSSRYEILTRLGSGGMGDVFLTVLRGPQGFTRHFVLKRLKPELQAIPEAVSQFVQEAQLGASLSHHNIAPVFDFGRDAQGYYLTQEYVPGRSVEALLQESLRRDGQALSQRVALGITHQVLAALAYAHGKAGSAGAPLGIVHRDVSPTNVMIAETGVVKLVDFGIVKSDQPVVTTRAGVIKGNPYFMPPEQARGTSVDHRADLFSAGMLLFHMVTGAPLYDGEEPYGTLNRAAIGPTVDDLTRVRRLGTPLSGIILKAIAADIGERFQSARSFAAAIEATQAYASVVEIEATIRDLFAAQLAVENARYGIGP